MSNVNTFDFSSILILLEIAMYFKVVNDFFSHRNVFFLEIKVQKPLFFPQKLTYN